MTILVLNERYPVKSEVFSTGSIQNKLARDQKNLNFFDLELTLNTIL